MNLVTPVAFPARDPTPAYHRIFQNLRRRIAVGEYAVDDQLPTEEELVGMFGVSRHTVRAAVQQLVAQGLVRRQAGRGTFVLAGEGGAWAARSLEDMLNRNFGDRIEDATMRLLPAGGAEEALAHQRFRDTGAVMGFTWLRSGPEGPNAACEVVLRKAHADLLPHDWAEQIKRVRLLHLVEACCGVEAERVRQASSALAATPEMAARLGVTRGAPLLSLERTYFDRDGQVVEHSRIVGRADRCQQVVELFRTGAVARGPAGA